MKIDRPNDSGSTMCVVRYQVETPFGWVGAWDREALRYLIDHHDQTTQKEKVTEEKLSCPTCCSENRCR